MLDFTQNRILFVMVSQVHHRSLSNVRMLIAQHVNKFQCGPVSLLAAQRASGKRGSHSQEQRCCCRGKARGTAAR